MIKNETKDKIIPSLFSKEGKKKYYSIKATTLTGKASTPIIDAGKAVR